MGPLAAALLIGATVGISAAGAEASTQSGRAQVTVFGDSLLDQAIDTVKVDTSATSHINQFVFPGTANCDWLAEMTTVAPRG